MSPLCLPMAPNCVQNCKIGKEWGGGGVQISEGVVVVVIGRGHAGTPTFLKKTPYPPTSLFIITTQFESSFWLWAVSTLCASVAQCSYVHVSIHAPLLCCRCQVAGDFLQRIAWCERDWPWSLCRATAHLRQRVGQSGQQGVLYSGLPACWASERQRVQTRSVEPCVVNASVCRQGQWNPVLWTPACADKVSGTLCCERQRVQTRSVEPCVVNASVCRQGQWNPVLWTPVCADKVSGTLCCERQRVQTRSVEPCVVLWTPACADKVSGTLCCVMVRSVSGVPPLLWCNGHCRLIMMGT